MNLNWSGIVMYSYFRTGIWVNSFPFGACLSPQRSIEHFSLILYGSGSRTSTWSRGVPSGVSRRTVCGYQAVPVGSMWNAFCKFLKTTLEFKIRSFFPESEILLFYSKVNCYQILNVQNCIKHLKRVIFFLLFFFFFNYP